ncbi:MAG: hypothetical protein R3C02_16800 [Planctomycetaceae bacterium]
MSFIEATSDTSYWIYAVAVTTAGERATVSGAHNKHPPGSSGKPYGQWRRDQLEMLA